MAGKIRRCSEPSFQRRLSHTENRKDRYAERVRKTMEKLERVQTIRKSLEC